jgi:NAD(P)-dependent dehydrogenase (short-subunit alcohol dehydrogenase family)
MTDTGALAGKVAVLTGAAGEIGQAYSAALVAAGMSVVEVDLGFSSGTGESTTVRRVQVDVADAAETRELADLVRRDYGRCDVLVNNAAIYRDMRLDPQLTVEIAYWRKVFSVNVDGALLCTQALAPMMIEQRWGRIVNQTSIAAYQGRGGHYGVTKLALIGLTHGFAQELGPYNITVNAIAPGPVFTTSTLDLMPAELLDRRLREMPVARRATPKDLTGTLLFLLSEPASWVTGQVHVVDGGLIRRL